MKNGFKTALTVLCLTSVMLFLTGSDCDKKDTSTGPQADDHPTDLVGDWILTHVTVPGLFDGDPADAGMEQTIILNADGTFTEISNMGEEDGPYAETGTWSATETTLTIEYEEETIVIPYTLDGNTLTGTVTDDGTQITLTFTKQPGGIDLQPDALVGTWVLDQVDIPGLYTGPAAGAGMALTIVLNDDGTYTLNGNMGDPVNETGTWMATTTIAVMSATGEEEPNVMDYILNGNQLTMDVLIDIDEDGDEEEMQMVFLKQ